MIASAGAEEYLACIDALLTSDEIDALMTIFIPAGARGAEETAIAIRDAAFAHHGEKTFLTVYMSSGGAPRLFSSGGRRIPTYEFPEQAAFALSRAVEYQQWREKDEGAIVDLGGIDAIGGRAIVAGSLESKGAGWLEPEEVEQVLEAYGLRMPHSAVAATADAAVAEAAALGGPVVLKGHLGFGAPQVGCWPA